MAKLFKSINRISFLRKKLILNKISIFFIFILLIFLCQTNVLAREVDYFTRPQAGIWFGVLQPVYTTYDLLGTAIGGGAFFRYNTPVRDLKVGLETSYQDYGPRGLRGVNYLTLWPIYGDLLYRIPVSLKVPFTFQLKAGAGATWVKIRPDRVTQWDPLGMLGFEFSFAAGRLINIGLRIDYLLIYEQHIEGAQRNGHVLNAGISIYFNI
jgi:hypothetical protein